MSNIVKAESPINIRNNSYFRICFEMIKKSITCDLYESYTHHCFCRFREKLIINSEPSIVLKP